MIRTYELASHPDTAARFARALQLEADLDTQLAAIARTAGLQPAQVMGAMIAARSEHAADDAVKAREALWWRAS